MSQLLDEINKSYKTLTEGNKGENITFAPVAFDEATKNPMSASKAELHDWDQSLYKLIEQNKKTLSKVTGVAKIDSPPYSEQNDLVADKPLLDKDGVPVDNYGNKISATASLIVRAQHDMHAAAEIQSRIEHGNAGHYTSKDVAAYITAANSHLEQVKDKAWEVAHYKETHVADVKKAEGASLDSTLNTIGQGDGVSKSPPAKYAAPPASPPPHVSSPAADPAGDFVHNLFWHTGPAPNFKEGQSTTQTEAQSAANVASPAVPPSAPATPAPKVQSPSQSYGQETSDFSVRVNGLSIPVETGMLPPGVPAGNALFTLSKGSKGQQELIPVTPDTVISGSVYALNQTGGVTAFYTLDASTDIGMMKGVFVTGDGLSGGEYQSLGNHGNLTFKNFTQAHNTAIQQYKDAPASAEKAPATSQPAVPQEVPAQQTSAFSVQVNGKPIPVETGMLPPGVPAGNALFTLSVGSTGQQLIPVGPDTVISGSVYALNQVGGVTAFATLDASTDIGVMKGVLVIGDGLSNGEYHRLGNCGNHDFKDFRQAHNADIQKHAEGHSSATAATHSASETPAAHKPQTPAAHPPAKADNHPPAAHSSPAPAPHLTAALSAVQGIKHIDVQVQHVEQHSASQVQHAPQARHR